VEKKGEVNFFTSQMIQDCMRKVITVNLHQTVKVIQLGRGRHAGQRKLPVVIVKAHGVCLFICMAFTVAKTTVFLGRNSCFW